MGRRFYKMLSVMVSALRFALLIIPPSAGLLLASGHPAAGAERRASSPVTFAAETEKNKYVPGELLVKFVSSASESEKDEVRQQLKAQKVKFIKSIQVEYWRLPEDVSVDDALQLLRNSPIIEYAEPNYLYKPQVLPNDSYFGKQWYLKNTGQSVNGITGKPGADISAPQAWDIETGSHDVVIAVIDSGVAFDHPDLINNVWTNYGEIPDNGIDDDNNGYVDDVHGWDFFNNENNPSDYSKGITNRDGHGTHVAGIIAGKGNNGLGVTGVMWQAQIMPLQVSYLGPIDSARIISAIEYSVNNGAKIINCSFGESSFSQAQYDIINYAHQKGVLVSA